MPPVVGEKNAGKFTPHVAHIRGGQFATSSEMQSMWSYVSGLARHEQFNFLLDDRTFEDNTFADEKMMHARGLGAQYYLMKGNLARCIRKIKDARM